MLEVRDIDCFYANVQVLRALSLSLAAGEVLCLLGRNGVGKRTTLKTIMGLIRARSGRVTLAGIDLTALPAHEIPKQGMAYFLSTLKSGLVACGEGGLSIGAIAGF